MPVSKQHFRAFWIYFVLILFGADACGQTFDSHPLAPPDTSSPQATLRGFLTAVDKGLTLESQWNRSYLASERLYTDDLENRLRAETDKFFIQALETLDLSQLPSGFLEVLAVEQGIRLSEILSRLDLPDFEDIPNSEEMKARGEKRWTIPNTRIEISLVDEGPRQGEYLFSARTVGRLGEFFDRVASLPYKPGSLKRFVDELQPYTSAATLYDIYRNATIGLAIVPGRWMLSMPTWLMARILGVAIWQWIGLMVYVLIGALCVWLVRFVSRKIGSNSQWCLFLTVTVVSVFAGLMVPLSTQLHISGSVLIATGTASVAVLYLAAAWAVFIGGGATAETIVRKQQLRTGAIDSQLIRLGARMIGLVIAIALLIEGADELGLPAYSVLTGLGIGGLAVAFAARETLANLLGSIVIMLEKPFRSGHWIKVGEAEGTVEYVGFRSTRIRTFEDSLISVPNSVVANAVIDNFGVRGRRRQRFFVQITYGTPPEKVESFVDGIQQIITDHPLTDKDVSHIHFNNFGESGLDILLYFHLRVPDFATELREREAILMKILTLAKEVGVEFAFPTRTLHVDETPDGAGRTRYLGSATPEN